MSAKKKGAASRLEEVLARLEHAELTPGQGARLEKLLDKVAGVLSGLDSVLDQIEALLPEPHPAGPSAEAMAAGRTSLEEDDTSSSGKSPLGVDYGADGAEYSVWCDGSCSPNPGPGGWGAIIDNGGERREMSGASPSTTNNIMEMSAAIAALETIPAGASVHITTDSRYLMDGITRWLAGWKRKGWRKSNGAPVLNRTYWEKLEALRDQRSVEWAWVRGHSGHPENERCDELANEARKALSYP